MRELNANWILTRTGKLPSQQRRVHVVLRGPERPPGDWYDCHRTTGTVRGGVWRIGSKQHADWEIVAWLDTLEELSSDQAARIALPTLLLRLVTSN